MPRATSPCTIYTSNYSKLSLRSRIFSWHFTRSSSYTSYKSKSEPKHSSCVWWVWAQWLEFLPLYEPFKLARSSTPLPIKIPILSVPSWALLGPAWREISRFFSGVCLRWIRSWHRRPESWGRLWAHRSWNSDRRDLNYTSYRMFPSPVSCQIMIVDDKFLRLKAPDRQVHETTIRVKNAYFLCRAERLRNK